MKYSFFIYIFFCSFVHSSYLDRDEVHEFIDFMSENIILIKHICRVFSKAEKQQNIIDSMNRPAEKIVSWDQYKSRVSFLESKVGSFSEYLCSLVR